MYVFYLENCLVDSLDLKISYKWNLDSILGSYSNSFVCRVSCVGEKSPSSSLLATKTKHHKNQRPDITTIEKSLSVYEIVLFFVNINLLYV